MASETDSKSGICSPAGYNGKTPGTLTPPNKVYPASRQIGKKHVDMMEGPGSSDEAIYDNSKRG